MRAYHKFITLHPDYSVCVYICAFTDSEYYESDKEYNRYQLNEGDIIRLGRIIVRVKEIKLISMDFSNVEYADSLFEYCTSVEVIDLTKVSVGSLKSIKYMFNQCGELTSIYSNDSPEKEHSLQCSMLQMRRLLLYF